MYVYFKLSGQKCIKMSLKVLNGKQPGIFISTLLERGWSEQSCLFLCFKNITQCQSEERKREHSVESLEAKAVFKSFGASPA